VSYLREVIDGMGIEDNNVVYEINDALVVTVKIETAEHALLIGKRGETLNSLQYLTGLIANKGRPENEHYKISLDCGDYRDKRESALRALARKKGKFVQKTGKSIELEPMNPYERRIVHTTIQEMENICSQSTGEDKLRHITIALKEGCRPMRFNKFGGGRGGFNNRGRGGFGGNRRPYNNNGGGFNRPYQPRPFNAEGNANTGETKPYERKPYNNNYNNNNNNNGGGYNRNYNSRPYNKNNSEGGEQKPYERRPYNNNSYNSRPYSNNRPYNNYNKPNENEKKPESFAPREPHKDDTGVSLYGKIEPKK
jgi:spoIIIJ-associated protein